MDKYQQSHKDKLFKPDRPDAYAEAHRPRGLAQCPRCGAKYHAGQWTWHLDLPAQSVEAFVCPACRRVDDQAPAGQVRVSGNFLKAHEDEIIRLMRNEEERAKHDHALERLITIVRDGEELLATTTGTHLVNRIGHALEAAYDGQSSYRHSDSEYYLSVDWHRD
ncbi:BCAM0308 family protein [Pseudomonas sp. 273]|uniref:BCAM0308 family protein n=1 Tax=Pseudomonas sp. 273 TaxID=75692 RepID=UPI0023D7D087|nr:BCAM0308 family protein [Pseudomonas sp. 273]